MEKDKFMSKPNLNVAIGLLVHQNRILVGWREENQHQGNKHEFPGGKVEAGETPVEACRREIYEEVGLNVGLDHWKKFDVIRHEYDDVIVQLHFFIAYLSDEESQKVVAPWKWIVRDQLLQLNFPKANTSIVKRLYWQRLIKISHVLSSLNHIPDDRLLYWRIAESEFSLEEFSQYSIEKLSKIIVNINIFNQLGELQKNAIQTIHLKQDQLLQLGRNQLDSSKRYIAACHNLEALKHAEEIGCDATFLSPVLATETHPDAQALGWGNFAEMALQANLVIFALGGVSPELLNDAQNNHAYGVAGIRSF